MKNKNLYHALIIKFGTMEKAAKALGTKPEILRKRATGEAEIPFRFLDKAVKALGIENSPETIIHVFGF